MTTEPDRDLDKATVALVVREQFGLEAREVELIGEGWDNEVFAVDDWFFRFPKRANTVATFEREIAITPIFAAALPIRVPHFELLGEPGAHFPYPFLGYRGIPGIAADQGERTDPSFAMDLGRTMSALHDIDPALIPQYPAPEWGLTDAIDDLVQSAEIARPHVPPAIRDAAEPYLRGEVPPPEFLGTPRVLHGDICPDHVIVEASTGRLVGMIDFADSDVGDPIFDFTGLIAIGGFGLVDEVLEHYSPSLDDGFMERLIWAARVLHLRWLGQSAEMQPTQASNHQRSDLTKHQRWVTEAFARSPA